MAASIAQITFSSQGVNYIQCRAYNAKNDPAHSESSASQGRGATALRVSGCMKPEEFQVVLEGHVRGGRRLGRQDGTGPCTTVRAAT